MLLHLDPVLSTLLQTWIQNAFFPIPVKRSSRRKSRGTEITNTKRNVQSSPAIFWAVANCPVPGWSMERRGGGGEVGKEEEKTSLPPCRQPWELLWRTDYTRGIPKASQQPVQAWIHHWNGSPNQWAIERFFWTVQETIMTTEVPTPPQAQSSLFALLQKLYPFQQCQVKASHDGKKLDKQSRALEGGSHSISWRAPNAPPPLFFLNSLQVFSFPWERKTKKKKKKNQVDSPLQKDWLFDSLSEVKQGLISKCLVFRFHK